MDTPLTASSLLDRTDQRVLLRSYDLLTDTLFWIKDEESRIVHANQCFVRQFGADDLTDLLGKNDYDFSPATMAKQFIEDDRKVIQGKPVFNRIELNILRSGEIGWFETSKLPLLDNNGDIIGTFGLSRRRDRSRIPLIAVEQLETSFAFIRSRFTHDISVAELAEHSHLSISALERRFKRYLNQSPKQFINSIRLHYAKHLLTQDNDSIANIATASGFSDPNYFTRLFSNTFGCSPREFRSRPS